MKKREEVQFFDGLLLGGLVAGLIIVVLIVFFVFQQANIVGEGDIVLQQVISIEPTNDYKELDDIGQSVTIAGETFVIHSSFTEVASGLTYRGLSDAENNLFASLWSKEGQQLLYKANETILTVSGNMSVTITAIKSESELLMLTESGQILIYDLAGGMVMPSEL